MNETTEYLSLVISTIQMYIFFIENPDEQSCSKLRQNVDVRKRKTY